MINLPLRTWFAASFALALGMAAGAAEPTGKAAPEFGKDVQLAPFVVNGRKLSISIYARTPADRKYGEQFVEEVVGIAYETLEKSTGAGLVIVGREGEPHPLVVFKKFQDMAAAGQLDPAVAARSAELTAMLADWKSRIHMEEAENKDQAEAQKTDKGEVKEFKVTLDMIMPALPLPLEGLLAKLYQLSWAEDFDSARVEQKLRSLTLADLEGNALSKYDWVFYLPPRNAFKGVMDGMMKQFAQQEKMGLFKRAALKSALFVFSPAIKTAVEGMRKSMLYLTVLRAESPYSQDDIMALTGAYGKVLMPDFKFNGGTEHKRALEAIEAQKVLNAEYAKDPFVSPARLATFDPVAYAPFEGEYAVGTENEDGKDLWSFQRKDGDYLWQHRDGKPLALYPAGDRLFVSANGRLTIEFKVDEKGAVTGAEERRVRHRHTFPRKLPGGAAGIQPRL